MSEDGGMKRIQKKLFPGGDDGHGIDEGVEDVKAPDAAPAIDQIEQALQNSKRARAAESKQERRERDKNKAECCGLYW